MAYCNRLRPFGLVQGVRADRQLWDDVSSSLSARRAALKTSPGCDCDPCAWYSCSVAVHLSSSDLNSSDRLPEGKFMPISDCKLLKNANTVRLIRPISGFQSAECEEAAAGRWALPNRRVSSRLRAQILSFCRHLSEPTKTIHGSSIKK